MENDDCVVDDVVSLCQAEIGPDTVTHQQNDIDRGYRATVQRPGGLVPPGIHVDAL